jgi:hypothetical protein
MPIGQRVTQRNIPLSSAAFRLLLRYPEPSHVRSRSSAGCARIDFGWAGAKRRMRQEVPLDREDSSQSRARWIEAMRCGAFAEAWKIADADIARRRRSGDWAEDKPLHLRPLWDGTDPTGRHVLVRCHHGLGDSIQFLRFVPRLKSIARSVAIQAQPALLPLLETLDGADRLVSLDESGPPHDVAIESTELPHVLRVTLETLPADMPYLRLAGAGRRVLARGPARRVGLVWRGGDWDPRRSLPLAALAPLAELGATLVNLQYDSTDGEIAAGRLRFAEPDPPNGSIVATARRMLGLDLLVSIDSMPAHLAGALGLPVWLLLHSDADWRWMRGRSDSPWYPTMRLFRQERAGSWQAPVARLAGSLAAAMSRAGAYAGTDSSLAMRPRL